MDIKTIDGLLQLARLSISTDEKEVLLKDIGSILAYVEQIEKLPGDVFKESHVALNYLREDIVTNEPGSFTEKLLEEMPDTEGGFLKVKQIL